MHMLRNGLMVLALLGLAACGDDTTSTNDTDDTGYEDTNVNGVVDTTPAAALEGESWMGNPIDPTAASAKVRVISFFKPG